MNAVLFGWPFFALGAGLVALAAMLVAPRPAQAPPRWRDPAWLVCLTWPVYMVHQFEEHGVDLLGRRYHFLVEMCTMLGHADLAGCPADPAFILAVNVGGVWLAGLTAVVWRRRNPMVGACVLGLPLVNGFAHLGPAIVHGQYNSGVLTGTLLFLPLGAYVVRELVRARVLEPRRIPVVFASGGVVHAVLLGALLAYGAGLLPHAAMLAIQVLNGLVPLAFGTLFRSRAHGSGVAN